MRGYEVIEQESDEADEQAQLKYRSSVKANAAVADPAAKPDAILGGHIAEAHPTNRSSRTKVGRYQDSLV